MQRFDCNYIADAQDTHKKYRLTCLENELEQVMSDFKSWVEDNELSPKDIWYCHVFEQEDYTNKLLPVGEITLLPNGEVEFELKDKLRRRFRLFRRR